VLREVLTRKITLDDWKRHAAAHPLIGSSDERIYADHPICPRCEAIMLRGNGRKGSWGKHRIATCPACGYQGTTTLVMREYIEEELYRR